MRTAHLKANQKKKRAEVSDGGTDTAPPAAAAAPPPAAAAEARGRRKDNLPAINNDAVAAFPPPNSGLVKHHMYVRDGGENASVLPVLKKENKEPTQQHKLPTHKPAVAAVVVKQQSSHGM